MRALSKILRERESEHSCHVFEQLEQRPKFASILNWMEPFDIPNRYTKTSKCC